MRRENEREKRKEKRKERERRKKCGEELSEGVRVGRLGAEETRQRDAELHLRRDIR